MSRIAAWRVVVPVVLACVTIGCLCEPCSKARRNEETVMLAFDAVESGDFDVLDRVIAEDYVRHCQATPDIEVTSVEQLKTFLAADRAAVPDPSLEVVHLFAQKDLVAFWAVYRGTQTGQMGPFPPSGRKVALDFAGVHRVVGGKIVETWVTWDNMAMLRQLGHLPPTDVEPAD